MTFQEHTIHCGGGAILSVLRKSQIIDNEVFTFVHDVHAVNVNMELLVIWCYRIGSG